MCLLPPPVQAELLASKVAWVVLALAASVMATVATEPVAMVAAAGGCKLRAVAQMQALRRRVGRRARTEVKQRRRRN